MDKTSNCLTQLGPPNPLEGCINQFQDTKVARHLGVKKVSHRALWWNPPLLGTTIWSTLSELWYITRGTHAKSVSQNCGSLDYAMHKKQAISLFQVSWYAFDKHWRKYGSTNMVLHAITWNSTDYLVATPKEVFWMLKRYLQTWH